MNVKPSPSGWDALRALRDDDIPLLWAALLIARDEYPELDISYYEDQVAGFERTLRQRIDDDATMEARLTRINEFLFSEQGFVGNDEDFYDPRNSYLNEVFDRKLGIPISLAVLQLELARRVGVPLEGVSFPGHFLVRVPVDGGLLVLDPYSHGRSLGTDELRTRAKPHVGEVDDADLLRMLAPASHRSILLRMLRNLKAVYAERETWDKALRCSDRLVALDPHSADEYRDRGLLYLRLDHASAAREDLTRYLAESPEADDVDEVRLALIEASGRPPSMH